MNVNPEEPRFYDRRSNDIPDLTINFLCPGDIYMYIYKSGARLQRYPDLTI